MDLAPRRSELLARGNACPDIGDEVTRAQFVQCRCHPLRWNGSFARELVRIVIGMALNLNEQPRGERTQSFAGALDDSRNVLALHIAVGERRQRRVNLCDDSILVGRSRKRFSSENFCGRGKVFPVGFISLMRAGTKVRMSLRK